MGRGGGTAVLCFRVIHTAVKTKYRSAERALKKESNRRNQRLSGSVISSLPLCWCLQEVVRVQVRGQGPHTPTSDLKGGVLPKTLSKVKHILFMRIDFGLSNSSFYYTFTNNYVMFKKKGTRCGFYLQGAKGMWERDSNPGRQFQGQFLMELQRHRGGVLCSFWGSEKVAEMTPELRLRNE